MPCRRTNERSECPAPPSHFCAKKYLHMLASAECFDASCPKHAWQSGGFNLRLSVLVQNRVKEQNWQYGNFNLRLSVLVQNRVKDITAEDLQKLLADCFCMATDAIEPHKSCRASSLEDMESRQVEELAGQVTVRFTSESLNVHAQSPQACRQENMECGQVTQLAGQVTVHFSLPKAPSQRDGSCSWSVPLNMQTENMNLGSSHHLLAKSQYASISEGPGKTTCFLFLLSVPDQET